MPTFYESVDAEVDIDPSEYWDQCSDHEKRELVDAAVDDGYAANINDESFRAAKGQTYTDQEVIRLLEDMWQNRQHIDLKTVDRLREQLKAERIL
jgi:hypothetical protein